MSSCYSSPKESPLTLNLMPNPCSHFYFDIKFGDRLYSKEKRPGSPLLFWIWSVAKFESKSDYMDRALTWPDCGKSFACSSLAFILCTSFLAVHIIILHTTYYHFWGKTLQLMDHNHESKIMMSHKILDSDGGFDYDCIAWWL